MEWSAGFIYAIEGDDAVLNLAAEFGLSREGLAFTVFSYILKHG